MRSLFVTLSLLMAMGLSAQTEVDFLNAIGKGDLSKVNAYLAPNITLNIGDNQKNVSRKSAIRELKTFFSTKKIQKFKILHNGKAADKSSSYRVARMKTSNGTFRIFAYSEAKGGSSKVIEIRVDPM